MVVRELDYATEADIFGALRFEVFVTQLGWLPGDPIRHIELDQLDASAHHLGAINQQLDGYVRLIQGGMAGGLLLQQPEFAPLYPSGLVIDHTTGEVSRLCVRPGRASVDPQTDAEVVRQLIRACYDLAMRLGITTLYATTSDTMGGYINRWFLEQMTFVVKAGPHQFESGVNTYLMAVDVIQMSTNPFVRHYLRL